jgi:heme-degrading monooxygenase HmoA
MAADLETIDALRAGDEAAFARLVARYQPAFVRTARVWVKDADAAREVVQATWLAALRTRLRADADRAAYEALNATMWELVQRIPGFIAAAGYTADSGDEIGVIRFASLDALRAWREHPEHIVVQQRGRAEFYASYTIEVCEVVRAYEFDVGSGEPSHPPPRQP